MKPGHHANKSRCTPCGGTGWRSILWCVETYGPRLGPGYHEVEKGLRQHAIAAARGRKTGQQ